MVIIQKKISCRPEEGRIFDPVKISIVEEHLFNYIQGTTTSISETITVCCLTDVAFLKGTDIVIAIARVTTINRPEPEKRPQNPLFL